MPALAQIQLIWKFTSTSPVIDNPSFSMVYTTAATSPPIGDVQDLMNQLANIFLTIQTGQTKQAAWYMGLPLSSATSASVIEAYDISGHLDGSPHGAPVAMKNFTLLSARGGTLMPEGVCVAIGLRAPYSTDVEFAPGARPRSRDRGRIYFGPVNSAAMGLESVTNRTQVASGPANDLLKWIHAGAVITAAAGTVWDLGVWSRVGEFVKSVTEILIDDRPDYQRRRADQATIQYSQAVP